MLCLAYVAMLNLPNTEKMVGRRSAGRMELKPLADVRLSS